MEQLVKGINMTYKDVLQKQAWGGFGDPNAPEILRVQEASRGTGTSFDPENKVTLGSGTPIDYKKSQKHKEIATAALQGAADGGLSMLQGAVRGVDDLAALATTVAKVPVSTVTGAIGSVPKALSYPARWFHQEDLANKLNNAGNYVWNAGRTVNGWLDQGRQAVSNFTDYSDNYYEGLMFDKNNPALGFSRGVGQYVLPALATMGRAPAAPAASGVKASVQTGAKAAPKFFSGITSTNGARLGSKALEIMNPLNALKPLTVSKPIMQKVFGPQLGSIVHGIQPGAWGTTLQTGVNALVRKGGTAIANTPAAKYIAGTAGKIMSTPTAQKAVQQAGTAMRPLMNSPLAQYIKGQTFRNHVGTATGVVFPYLDKAFGLTNIESDDSNGTKALKATARYAIPAMGLYANATPAVNTFMRGALGGDDAIANGAGYLLARNADFGDKTQFGNSGAAVNFADQHILPGIKDYLAEPYDSEAAARLVRSGYEEYKKDPQAFQDAALTAVTNPKKLPETALVQNYRQHIPSNIWTRMSGLAATTPTAVELLKRNLGEATNGLFPGSNMGKSFMQGATQAYQASPRVQRQMIGDKGVRAVDIAKKEVIPFAQSEYAKYQQAQGLRPYLVQTGYDLLTGKTQLPPSIQAFKQPVLDILGQGAKDYIGDKLHSTIDNAVDFGARAVGRGLLRSTVGSKPQVQLPVQPQTQPQPQYGPRIDNNNTK